MLFLEKLTMLSLVLKLPQTRLRCVSFPSLQPRLTQRLWSPPLPGSAEEKHPSTPVQATGWAAPTYQVRFARQLLPPSPPPQPPGLSAEVFTPTQGSHDILPTHFLSCPLFQLKLPLTLRSTLRGVNIHPCYVCKRTGKSLERSSLKCQQGLDLGAGAAVPCAFLLICLLSLSSQHASFLQNP